MYFQYFYFYFKSRTTHYFTYVCNLRAFGSSHLCGQDLFDLITVKFCEWIKLETCVFPDCSHASLPPLIPTLYLLFTTNLQATDISLFTYLFLELYWLIRCLVYDSNIKGVERVSKENSFNLMSFPVRMALNLYIPFLVLVFLGLLQIICRKNNLREKQFENSTNLFNRKSLT